MKHDWIIWDFKRGALYPKKLQRNWVTYFMGLNGDFMR
jgi:hypothetical protein